MCISIMFPKVNISRETDEFVPADSVRRFTDAVFTPGISAMHRSILATQLAHDMPPISITTRDSMAYSLTRRGVDKPGPSGGLGPGLRVGSDQTQFLIIHIRPGVQSLTRPPSNVSPLRCQSAAAEEAPARPRPSPSPGGEVPSRRARASPQPQAGVQVRIRRSSVAAAPRLAQVTTATSSESSQKFKSAARADPPAAGGPGRPSSYGRSRIQSVATHLSPAAAAGGRPACSVRCAHRTRART
jgi:hypothetical protein